MRASPDVESVPPEPMPTADGAWDPDAAPDTGRGWAGVVTLLLAWGFLLSVAFLAFGHVAAVRQMPRVPVDVWVALASLALLALGLAWWTWRSLRPGADTRERGDSQWSIAARHFRK